MILPSHLSVRDGRLAIGEHDTVDLARQFGTPLYVTSEDRIRENFQRLSGALTAHYPKVRVLYAAKANGNLAVFRTLASMGAGADVFSAGEVALALASGMRPASLLFNGSSKTPSDLVLAVEKGIRVSVDSPDELRQLDAAAGKAGKTVDIAFRVNPAIEVPTHPKIATGLATSKFGIPAGQILDAYREALAALETLAVIAYKQPVLRAEIEAIRGVACGEMIRTLMEKDLVKIVGRAEELGRPMLYGTTK